MEELIVLVNEKDEQIGVAPKLAAHNANTPLHRAFSCYVFNPDGEFLLTQRALSKKVFPGVWTNSCCGHPAPGEKTEDAIKRRLLFELGLIPEDIFVVLPNFRYRAEMQGIVENEICPVYIAMVKKNPKPNPLEVEAYQWIEWKEFQQKITKDPGGYSYWCVKQVEQLKKSFVLPTSKKRTTEVSFTKYLEKSANKIELYIKEYFNTWSKKNDRTTPRVLPLVTLLKEGCTGGKRIRGTLVSLGYDLANTHELKENEEVMKVAAAYEIFQTAILAHDDIIDKSRMRRGQPTIYVKLGGDHYGVSQTISLGDLGFFMAYKSIAESTFPDFLKVKTLDFFSEKLMQTVLGQMLDVELSHEKSLANNVVEEEILTVYKYKTAYYTFVAPLSLGAILGGADAKIITKIASFGTDVGILFQLYDDIDDIFGDSQLTKKDIGIDIKEGKLTLLYSTFWQHATESQKNVFKKYYGKADSNKNAVREIRQLFVETKALDEVLSVAKEYEKRARLAVPSLTKDTQMRKMFYQIIDYVSRKEVKNE